MAGQAKEREGRLSAPEAPGKITGIITNIQVYSLHDGPGVRTIVFLKGCPLKCDWCCNPECIHPKPEVEFYKSKCIACGACLRACKYGAINPDLELKSGFKIIKEKCTECGDCARVCPTEALKMIGEVVTVDQVMEKVRKDKYFYLTSQGGLTISGGEPLYQFEFTRELLRQAHSENIHTAIETCGQAPWERYEAILPYLDLILFDIKNMDPARHKELTGASNEVILNNIRNVSHSGVPLVIRLPLIPGANIDDENIARTADFIATLKNVAEVNVMPFHQLGKDKYFRLSQEYSLKDLKAMGIDDASAEKIKEIRKTLESRGLKVTVGG